MNFDLLNIEIISDSLIKIEGRNFRKMEPYNYWYPTQLLEVFVRCYECNNLFVSTIQSFKHGPKQFKFSSPFAYMICSHNDVKFFPIKKDKSIQEQIELIKLFE